MAHLKSRRLDESHSTGMNSFERNCTGFLSHTISQRTENKTGNDRTLSWDLDLRKSSHKNPNKLLICSITAQSFLKKELDSLFPSLQFSVGARLKFKYLSFQVHSIQRLVYVNGKRYRKNSAWVLKYNRWTKKCCAAMQKVLRKNTSRSRILMMSWFSQSFLQTYFVETRICHAEEGKTLY